VRSKALIALVVLVPLTFAACGGDDDETSATSAETTTAAAGGGAGGTVDISETEFQLDPADATVPAGTVTINVTNDGATTHNLEVEGDGVEEITDDLEPGASGKLALDLQPGSYEMYCAIDEHKEQGMEGTLTVE
jgi:plastocyanin